MKYERSKLVNQSLEQVVNLLTSLLLKWLTLFMNIEIHEPSAKIIEKKNWTNSLYIIHQISASDI